MSEKISRRNWLKTGVLASSAVALAPSFASETEAGNVSAKQAIRLFSNENPYGFSPKAKQAIIDSVHLGNQYAHRNKVIELRNLIAEREGLKPENVILGSGSGEVLCMAGAAYGWQGGEIVTPQTTFPMLFRYAEKFNAKTNKVPLNSKFELDLNEMDKQISQKTSLVYVCNPNNPTGTMLPNNQVKDFCEAVSKRTTVYVDEAYLEFTNDYPRNSMVELVRQEKNVIVSRTFSKIYGMAGMRIGYGLAKKEIADKVKNFKMSWISSLGTYAAIESYKDTKFIKESAKKNNAVREMFSRELRKINMPHPKSHGNFLWIKGGKRFHNLHEKIRPSGLLVYSSRASKEEWARVSIGTEKVMKQLAKEFRKL